MRCSSLVKTKIKWWGCSVAEWKASIGSNEGGKEDPCDGNGDVMKEGLNGNCVAAWKASMGSNEGGKKDNLSDANGDGKKDGLNGNCARIYIKQMHLLNKF